MLRMGDFGQGRPGDSVNHRRPFHQEEAALSVLTTCRHMAALTALSMRDVRFDR